MLRSQLEAVRARLAALRSLEPKTDGEQHELLSETIEDLQAAFERIQVADDARRFLAEATTLLSSSLDYEATLQRLARLAVPALADYCVVDLYIGPNALRQVAVAHVNPAKEDLVRDLRRASPFEPGTAYEVAQVLRTGQPEMVSDLALSAYEGYAAGAAQRDLLRELGPRSYIVVPLKVRERTLGAISFLLAESGRRYGQADLDLAVDLADRAALAIDNARLYREAQEALQRKDDARALLDTLLATAPVGLCFVDPELRYVLINDALAAINGMRSDDHIGKRVDELLPNLDSGVVDTYRQVFLTGVPIVDQESDGETPAEPGKRRHFLSSYYPVIRADGQRLGVGAVVSDITDRKEAERELRQSRDQLAIILRGVADGITVQDPSGRLIYVNDAAARLSGYPSAQVMLEAPAGELVQEFDLLDEAGNPYQVSELPGRRALRGEDGAETVVRFRVRNTGEERWSVVQATPVRDEYGKVQLAVNIFHDVTERKLAEQTLHARAQQQVVVAALGQQALAGLDLDMLMADAVASVAETLGVEFCKILELLPNDQHLLIRAGVGWKPGVVGHALVDASPASQAGFTLRAAEPVLVEDLSVEPRFRGMPILHEHGVVSGMTVVIHGEGRSFGVLGAHTARRRAFSQDDANFLSSVANVLAAAIDRKRGEDALRESEARFRVMADGAPVLIWMADLDGRCTFFNRPWLEFTGRTLTEELGSGWIAGVHPEDSASALETYLSAFEARKPFQIEFRLRRADGEYRWMLNTGEPRSTADGSLAGFIGSCVDITDRKRAEELLRFPAEASSVLAASLDYETTLQNVARLVVPYLADWCTIDLLEEDGSLSPVAMAHVDAAKVEWAQKLRKSYPPDLGAPTGLPKVLRTGTSEFYPYIGDEMLVAGARDEGELQMNRAIGLTSVMIVPLRARGRTLGALSFVSAESRRHYTEEDLRLAEELASRAALAVDNARLYQDAQKAVHVRDEFLSIAAHELKTPVTSLLAYTQVLQRRAAHEKTASERDLRALTVIGAQADRLSRLITSLLDLSRIETGHFTLERRKVDLSSLARRVVEEARPTIDRHAIDVTMPDEPLIVEGDDLRLEQVLQNLIQNAVKYSPAGGPIEVNVGREAECAMLEITDHGMGIPKAAQPQLFQRFYRASNVNGSHISGMGIGLYVVKEIVERHGGEVRIRSEEAEGTTVTVLFPLAAESAVRNRADPADEGGDQNVALPPSQPANLSGQS